MDEHTKKRFEKIEEKLSRIEALLNKGELLNKGRLVNCDRCGNSWITRSKADLVSCSKCGKKVKV
jgi:ribosomal protein S27E